MHDDSDFNADRLGLQERYAAPIVLSTPSYSFMQVSPEPQAVLPRALSRTPQSVKQGFPELYACFQSFKQDSTEL